MTNILILNGASSAGKTTLAKALQAQFDTPYLLAGIDKYIFMLPSKYLNPPLWSEIFRYEYADDGTINAVLAGDMGHRLVSAMHHSIAAIAGSGYHVIVDHVILYEAWLVEMATLFADFSAYLIGVQCSLDVLIERERERKDRTLGQAAAQYPVVHQWGTYDVEVDTALARADACAEQILTAIDENPNPHRLAHFRR